MMGDDLLVAPVVEKGAKTRKVVLPPGKWHADDGRTYNGLAEIEVATPLDRLAHFVKIGEH
jgi:alpha-glucosidase